MITANQVIRSLHAWDSDDDFEKFCEDEDHVVGKGDAPDNLTMSDIDPALQAEHENGRQ